MHKSKEGPIGINELQSFMDHVESNIDVKYNSTLGQPFVICLQCQFYLIYIYGRYIGATY